MIFNILLYNFLKVGDTVPVKKNSIKVIKAPPKTTALTVHRFAKPLAFSTYLFDEPTKLNLQPLHRPRMWIRSLIEEWFDVSLLKIHQNTHS
jgi:hypothetical protein